MTELEELIAREAIRETKARYCRLLDTKQWPAWGELFTKDAEMDVSEDVKDQPDADPIIKGRDLLVSQTSALVHPARTMHHVHSPEINFVSDTEAKVVWAMEDSVEFDNTDNAPFKRMQACGHYHETYRYEQGQWRIAHLRLARLHQYFELH
jgi:3-phenylpropionate/cinnamic acid dioxygenase small subunit